MVHGRVAHRHHIDHLARCTPACVQTSRSRSFSPPTMPLADVRADRGIVHRQRQPRHHVFAIGDLRVGRARDAERFPAEQIDQIGGQPGRAHVHREAKRDPSYRAQEAHHVRPRVTMRTRQSCARSIPGRSASTGALRPPISVRQIAASSRSQSPRRSSIEGGAARQITHRDHGIERERDFLAFHLAALQGAQRIGGTSTTISPAPTIIWQANRSPSARSARLRCPLRCR